MADGQGLSDTTLPKQQRVFLGATYGTCLVHGTTPSNAACTNPGARPARDVPPVLPGAFSPKTFGYDIEAGAPTHCHPFWCQVEDVLVTRRAAPNTTGSDELVANLVPRIPVMHMLCIPVDKSGQEDMSLLPAYMFRDPQPFVLPAPGSSEAMGIANRIGMRLVREYLRSEGAVMKCLVNPDNADAARAACEKSKGDALDTKERAIRDARARFQVTELPPDELATIDSVYEAAVAAADYDMHMRKLPGYGIKDVVLRAHVNAIFEWGVYDKIETARMALLRAVRNRAKRRFESPQSGSRYESTGYTLDNLAADMAEVNPEELTDDVDPLDYADYEQDADLIDAYAAAKAEAMKPAYYVRPKVSQDFAFASFFSTCVVSECTGPVVSDKRTIGGQFRVTLYNVRPRFATWLLREAAAGTRAPRPPCASENMTQWVKTTFGTTPSQAARLAPSDIAATGMPSLSPRHSSLSGQDPLAYTTLFGYSNPKIRKKNMYLSSPFIGEYFLAWDAPPPEKLTRATGKGGIARMSKRSANSVHIAPWETLPFITAAIARTGSVPASYEFASRCAERLRMQLGVTDGDSSSSTETASKRRKLREDETSPITPVAGTPDEEEEEKPKPPSALEAQSGADAKAAKPWEAVKDPELMQKLAARRAKHPWFQWLTMSGMPGFNPCNTITQDTADTALDWASFTSSYLALIGVDNMSDQAFKPVTYAPSGPELTHANTLFVWVHRPEVLQIPSRARQQQQLDASPEAVQLYGLTLKECAHARELADALHASNTVLKHCTWRCTQTNLNLAYVQAVQAKIDAQYRIRRDAMRDARINATDARDKVPGDRARIVDGKVVHYHFEPPDITRFFRRSATDTDR